jgi:hypothetical protein
MNMKMAVRVGEKQTPETVLPTIRSSVKIVPKSVLPEGDLVYEGEVVREEVLSNGAIPEPIREKLAASLKTVQGMKVAATVTSRGVVKDATMQIPENASTEVRQALESTRDSLRTLCTPLPEEEVGQGARVDMEVWAGFRMAQATTITLKNLTPNRAKLDASFVQSAESQPVTGAGVPEGATLRLDHLSGKGSGTIDVTFDRVSPVSTVSSDTETAMTVSVEGHSMPTGTKMHFDVQVKPGK